MKRMIAMLLCLSILLGLAACGAPAKNDTAKQQEQQEQSVEEVLQNQDPQTLDREDKELIADLIGGQDASDLTDEELNDLIDQLVNETGKEGSQIVNLSTGKKPEQPTVDMTDKEEYYDENGAMKEPFDQVYPELIEKEQVAFSGESILVKLSSDTLTDGLKAAGIGALEEIVPMEKASWYEAKLIEGTDAQEALNAVRELKEVLLAEFNYEVQTAALDDYKHFDKDKEEEFKKNGHNKDQWHFHHCGIVDGYEEMDKEGGDSSVVVAVIDSGVDYDHEDLADNMWVNADEIPNNGRDDDGNGYVDDYYGVDIVAGKGNGDDTNGHGTHVAGIIAARNNNVGVMGIAYNVKIMSVKAAMHNGTLNQADIAKSVLYAYENGAEVINMSFGGTACSIAVQDALATAYTRCVLVASAGNSGYPNEGSDFYAPLPNYPAALTYVLGVMSVDESGKESVFTNWDTYAFSGVEYELYAPGENIMSTLPGDKYGYLSGTSMAAPVVSAFAAILRSEFADRDKYPTKFIYGQLASTSGNYADCCNPQMHTVGGQPHNLPQIANLNDALTKLPKPELNVQDYYIFDDPKYSDKNNGDGVIDAGETIALGLTIRNRWGMSENTLVTIDTISESSGMADPYFTIKNPTVNYGSVGTYSTQDCGKIYTDELFTGWEDPFLIEVSADCPNDYRFTLNVTITCENALDEADETVYVSEGKVDENVRSGYILPSIIDQDMVLTPENLYIIPNATIIEAGVTVRVEPGTHIQFWSDDADDPYADNYIAYLVVNGKFLVEGTKENPVYIYPSQLMDGYGVEIGATSSGYVSLKYADITNFGYYSNHTGTGNFINLAEHCTFRNNYSRYLYYRVLEDGVVKSRSSGSVTIGSMNAKDCVFYKIAYYEAKLFGGYDRCVFTQCGIDFGGTYGNTYQNCVFLDNSLVDQTSPNTHYNSSLDVSGLALPSKNESYENYSVDYRPETGTTYVRWYNGGYNYGDDIYAAYLREAFDGDYVKIETADEKAWLSRSSISYGCQVGIRWDKLNECYLWHDGTPVDTNLFPEAATRMGSDDNYVSLTHYTASLQYDLYYSVLFEIPGPILPTDITFREYAVDMDLETTYQLSPMNTPVQLPTNAFLYESSDESVLTVNETGLVTPVGIGTADVWVWSLDKAVKNRVTVTVREYVPLEGLTFPTQQLKLQVGTSAYAPCILTPADTTRRNVTYTSSDETVVAVQDGLLTAVGKGTATITATCEGVSATLEVSTWLRATSLTYQTQSHTRTRESCDTSLPEVVAYPANADLDLQWTSDNASVLAVEDGKLVMKTAGSAYLYAEDLNSGKKVTFHFTITHSAPVIQKDAIAVSLDAGSVALPELTWAEGAEATPEWKILDPAVATLEDGKIVLKGAGITTLRVTDPRTNLTDEIFIYVTEGEVPKIKQLQIEEEYYGYPDAYVLMENGDLYRWNVDEKIDPELVFSGVKAFDSSDSNVTVLLNDGTIKGYSWEKGYSWDNAVSLSFDSLQDKAVIAVSGYRYAYEYSYYDLYLGGLFALMSDGTVYAVGDNAYGQLGIGSTEETNEFTKVLINEPVVQVASGDNVAYFLTKAGNLYISGGTSLQMTTPIMIARNVTWLDNDGEWFVTNDHLASFKSNYTEPSVGTDSLKGYTVLDMDNKHEYGLAEKDGKIYQIYSSGRMYENPTLVLADQVVAGERAQLYHGGSYYYVLTADGMLFASGNNEYNNETYNTFLGMTADDYLGAGERSVFLPVVQPNETLNLLQTNLEGDVLKQETLELTFNKQLLNAKATIYENGTAMVAHTEIKNEVLRITPSVGFAENAVYTVEISASGTTGVSYVHPSKNITVEFTCSVEEMDTPEQSVPEETIPEEIVPDVTVAPTEPEEPVIYQAILDTSIQRYLTREILVEKINEFIEKTQYNPNFNGNAILNPISTDFEVSHWLRPLAPTITVGSYREIPFGGNYWGSTNQRAIELQMIDYTDFPNYARLMYAPYLTEAPENTFPFVTSVKLFNKDGEEVTTVGNEQVTFQVKFNRDMDTSIDLLVRFGSAFPYGDYEVEGKYVDARTWEGTYTLNTLIENGNQFFTISNGCSATDDLPLQIDQQRFGFVIDTTAAQALIMQGAALDTGIELKWTQDDFKTLMGYNVYRSTKEDGLYTRLNTTVIPADTMKWFDTTVEPGVVYYYNFTVVQTDLNESEPSGKIVIMSKDTMAPNIYHSPVTSAFTGSNLVLSATVTDNLNIAYANLYYRAAGAETWSTIRMNKLNDKYSAIIPAASVTVAGIEYYIEAFDGVSFTYKGSAETPYTIAVQEAIGADSLGDVDGDGVITNLDALLLLYTINDKYNMKPEEFARADLNGDGELWAAEALRILQYVSGVVGSVKM